MDDPEAPITLQIYADYQCPHCRAFFNNVEPQLFDNYVRKGQAKLELLDFTVVGVPGLEDLQDDSLESVQAAEAAMRADKQDALYYQTLFTGEMEPNSGAFSDVNLKATRLISAWRPTSSTNAWILVHMRMQSSPVCTRVSIAAFRGPQSFHPWWGGFLGRRLLRTTGDHRDRTRGTLPSQQRSHPEAGRSIFGHHWSSCPEFR